MQKLFGKKIKKNTLLIIFAVLFAVISGIMFKFGVVRQIIDSGYLSDQVLLGNAEQNNINDLNRVVSSKNYGNDMSVHFLNVSKADCAYINCKDVNILIDAADKEPTNTVTEYLKRQKVKKFDLVVMTHPHRDHIGQMAEVLNEFEVDKFIETDVPKNMIPVTVTYEKMLKALLDKQIPVERVLSGKNFKIGDLDIDILGPVKINKENINNNSVVMKITYKNVSFLFTGDASGAEERDILRHYNLSVSKSKKTKDEKNKNNLKSSKIENPLKATVLKVGHHGSNYSSTENFLNFVEPNYAVISTTNKNIYRMTESVTKRLEKYGSKVYKTCESGNVIFLTDGENIKVKTEK